MNQPENQPEPTFEILVDGMTCGHCQRAVHDAISSLPNVSSVTVDLQTGRVTGTGLVTPEALRGAIEEEGYTVRA